MAFRFRLVHHQQAAEDYRAAVEFFDSVDAGLAVAFKDDFKGALRGLATGRAATTLYASGHAVRWVKLRRFSHKIFFEPEGTNTRLVLAVVSGRRHPARIRQVLTGRRKR